MDRHCRNGVENHHLLVEISAYSSNQPPVAGQAGEGRFGNYFGETCWVFSEFLPPAGLLLCSVLYQTILMIKIKPGVY